MLNVLKPFFGRGLARFGGGVAFLSLFSACGQPIDKTFFQQAPRNFSYTQNQTQVQRLQPLSPLAPTTVQIGNSSLFHYSISPSLPEGIKINETTGIISGTASKEQAAKNFTVLLKNDGGFAQASVSIGVTAIPTSILHYPSSSIILMTGDAMDSAVADPAYAAFFPAVDGDPLHFEVQPALPSGFLLDSATGKITGTAGPVGTSAVNITASNTGGSKSTSVLFDIRKALTLTASPNFPTITKGRVIQFSAAGGVLLDADTYHYRVSLGSGSISPTGSFTATTVGAVQVEVSDSRGHLVTQNLTVVEPLSEIVTPAEMVLGETAQFLGKDGVPPYSYKALNGGTVDSNTGVFSAATVGAAYQVQVQDSIGNQSTASVKVSPVLNVTIANDPTTVGDSDTVTVAGGVGGVANYTYTPVGGSYSQTSSIFTATAAGPGSLTVKDLANHSKTVSFTIKPKLSLAIAPAEFMVGDTAKLTAAGGIGTYVYSISGGGSVDPVTGIITGATAGSYTATVKDSVLGHVATIGFKVDPTLAISFLSPVIAIGDSVMGSASGGVGVLTVTFSNTILNVDSSALPQLKATGLATGAGWIKVTDTLNHSQQATITVNPTFTVALNHPLITMDETALLTPAGGIPPYTYAVDRGGAVNPTSGVFTPSAIGISVVTVKDYAAHVLTKSIDVRSSLSFVGSVPSLFTGETITFTADGGQPPYTYTPSSNLTFQSMTSVAPYTVTYQANAAGLASVEVKDVGGRSKTATATLYDPYLMTLDKPIITLNEKAKFKAIGGAPPIVYSVDRGGAVDAATGLFTPSATGFSKVTARDSVGHLISKTVEVRANLSLAANPSVLIIGDTVVMTADGGEPPYVYTPSGNLTLMGTTTVPPYTATYQANASGAGSVQVKDLGGRTVSAAVTIYDTFTMSLDKPIITLNEKAQFKAIGGAPPIVYSVDRGGAVDPASGLFTPNATGFSKVTARDSVGHIISKTVEVRANISLTANPAVLVVGDTVVMTADGGEPPYTYVPTANLTFIGSTTVPPYTATYQANAPGAGSVQVKDASARAASASVTINAPLSLSLNPTLTAVGRTVTATGLGGTPPLTYSAAGVAFTQPQPNQFVFSQPGTASISVKDYGNIHTQTLSILVNPAISFSAAQLTIAVGDSDALTVSGGVLTNGNDYTFEVSNPALATIDGPSRKFTALAAGTVVIRARDSQAVASSDVTIVIKPALTAVAAPTTVAATNLSRITPSGGVGAYTYSADLGSLNVGPGSAYADLTAAANGNSNYVAHVTVRDGAGHSFIAPVTVVPLPKLTAPARLMVTATAPVSCLYGVGSLSFSWTPAAIGSVVNGTSGNATLQATAVGSGTLTCSDSFVPANSVTQAVSFYPALALSVDKPTINLGDSAKFTATGGYGTYTYTLVSGSGNLNSSTGAFVSTLPGLITVKATDSDGNAKTATVTVLNNPPIVVTPLPAIPVVPNEKEQFSATGGTGAPKVWSITSGAAFATITPSGGLLTGKAPGVVTVQVTDGNSTATFNVTVLASLVINPSNPTIVKFTSTNFTATGGEPPYKFAVVSGEGATIGVDGTAFSPLLAGPIVLSVTDSRGRMTQASFTVGRGALGTLDLSTGSANSCFVAYQEVWCWGDNVNKLAAPDNAAATINVPTQMRSFLVPMKSVVLAPEGSSVPADSAACALSTAGDIYCWGVTLGTPKKLTGFPVAAGPAKKLSLSHRMGCAVFTDSSVYCWPMINETNQWTVCSNFNLNDPSCPTGDAASVDINVLFGGVAGRTPGVTPAGVVTPRKITLPAAATDVATGEYHACAIVGGRPYCWGANSRGQVTNSKPTCFSFASSNVQEAACDTYALGTSRVNTPVAVPGFATGGVVGLALDWSSSCAMMASGGVSCWGDDATYYDIGQPFTKGYLGTGGSSTCKQWAQPPASGLGNYHTCIDQPRVVTTFNGFANGNQALQMAPSYLSRCVTAKTTGTGTHDFYCWGRGNPVNSTSPLKLTGLPTTMAKIAPGGTADCGFTSANELYCWGNNAMGGVGVGVVGGNYSATKIAFPPPP